MKVLFFLHCFMFIFSDSVSWIITDGADNAKKFQCSLCSYSSDIGSNLKRHLMVHTQERPFTCHICNKSFNHKVGLQNHKYAHLGIKPFTCKICSRDFTTKSNYRRHLATHHNT